jgi:4,5-DOPA dioxygenase extradiol
MPAVFIGHGSPMNALEDNDFTRAWSALAKRLPRPKAIVAISAHWETKGILITSAARQRTIHDFYNFPPALYAEEYPAPGDPALAKRIEQMLAPYARADLDSWGLDHGTWGVLKHVYPDADIPVVQVSMDIRLSIADHYRVGQVLGALRDEGVLIFGSGNIVHNLRLFDRSATGPAPWATAFNDAVKDKVLASDHEGLVNYEALPNANLAVPEAEHYQPLLYVLASQAEGEPVEILTDSVTGSISMTSVLLGAQAA